MIKMTTKLEKKMLSFIKKLRQKHSWKEIRYAIYFAEGYVEEAERLSKQKPKET